MLLESALLTPPVVVVPTEALESPVVMSSVLAPPEPPRPSVPSPAPPPLPSVTLFLVVAAHATENNCNNSKAAAAWESLSTVFTLPENPMKRHRL